MQHDSQRIKQSTHACANRPPRSPAPCRRVRLAVGHYTRRPLQASLAAPRAEIDPATFLPPPLRPRSVGWYPEWGKVWEKYGLTRHTW